MLFCIPVPKTFLKVLPFVWNLKPNVGKDNCIYPFQITKPNWLFVVTFCLLENVKQLHLCLKSSVISLITLRDWGDSSFDILWGFEFDPHHRGADSFSELGRRKLVDLWGSLIIQPSILGELWVSERWCLRNQGGCFLRWNIGSGPLVPTCAWMHMYLPYANIQKEVV